MLNPVCTVKYDFHGVSYDPCIDTRFTTIFAHRDGDKATNQQPCVAIAPDGAWVCTFTQASREAARDESVVVSRSRDGGKTWEEPVDIERAQEGRTASWGMAFCVPHTGRFYVFYWWNQKANRERDAGGIYFKYSDDGGANWSPRHAIAMPRHGLDREGCDSHGWNTGFPILTHDGAMLLGITKISPKGATRFADSTPNGNPDHWHTECFVLRCRNILEEADPGRLHFEVTPRGLDGLHAPHADDPALRFCQEPYLALAPGGRVLCTMRTRTGHPWMSYSDDHGVTWAKARPMRLRPGGELLAHVCGPCPITVLPDGRIVFWFSNNAEPVEGSWAPMWANRDPIFSTTGRMLQGLGAACPEEATNAGLYFTKPVPVLCGTQAAPDAHPNLEKANPRWAAAYPQLVPWAGRLFAVYSRSKTDIRLKEIPEAMFAAAGLPGG